MARLLTLATMIVTLSFGGVSAIQQDAVDAFHSAQSGLNSLSNDATSTLVNLHNTLPPNGS
jgi:hypothetical protein